MEFKADGDMSLKEYWGKHCTFIAKDRSWAIQEGDQYKSYYVEGGFSHLIHMTAAHLW